MILASIKGFCLPILAALSMATFVQAADLPSPSGDVILTVSGLIGNTNGGGVARFDMALLQTLPQYKFTTSTIWTEGVATYEGVLLADLLTAVGASGATVTATAINDYKISLPSADALPKAPLLAILTDGATMAVRDKGPIWLVYPFDEVAEYRTEKTYARSIWQLDRIEITQ